MALKDHFNPSEPGFWVSGVAHAALLTAALIGLPFAAEFPEAQEGIPVEVITDNQFSQITKGVTDAKAVQTNPKPRADRIADKAEQNAPGEEKVNAPAPPKRPEEMKVADKDEEAAAAAAAAAKAAEQKAAEVKAAEEKKAAEKAEAEAIEKAKIEQAKAEAEAKARAEAKTKAEAEAKRVAEQKAKEKADAEAKAKADAEAKRIADAKAKAEAEEKARKEAQVAKKLDMGDLKQFLDNKDKNKSTGATGSEVQKTASLGTATGTSAKLNPSMRDGLIGLLQDQMRQCYTAPLTEVKPPMIDVRLKEDGSLASQPVIVSTGSSSADRAAAEAAVRAVKRCAPYRIPAQYAPYYNEWKYLNVAFDAA